VRDSAQLAAILEVSGWPKPGNVHRTANHLDTRYEHFLAGSVALGSSIEDATMKGIMVAREKLDVPKIGIGKLVKNAVLNIGKAHKGGNTHLGICLLFIPLATSAAKTYAETHEITPITLQHNMKEIMQKTQPQDAIHIYKVITMFSSSLQLGRVESKVAPDLYDKQAVRKILENKTTLFEIMKQASTYDTVAKELTNGLEISTQIGYKELIETYNQTNDINMAIVHTFLKILSKVPDTFIARKVGLKKVDEISKAVQIGLKETKWISKKAEKILKSGGLLTKGGTKLLWNLDRKLQEMGNKYSPGTTADLTATSLMIALLCGLKF
jgi:triphosphoribosyl-dephospho-CoA synthase